MATIQTTHPKPNTVQRQWFLVDAENVPLGRLATLSAGLLRGKGKATFNTHQDLGDGVIVINAAKVALTGNKKTQKIDFRASGYRGGQAYTPYGRLLAEKPERAVELAVYGMLPKNRLRDRFMRRLKVYRAAEGAKVYSGAQAVDTKNPKLRSGGPVALASGR
jgi:large subunit ribosomal protein L13